MGKPVVHFEVIGKDSERLQSYYADLFDWKIDASNPMKYGIVKGEDNPSSMGSIGGGVGWGGPDADEGHVAFAAGQAGCGWRKSSGEGMPITSPWKRFCLP
jgi:predicted enzyme related to lactoylglutathione lyase